MELIKKYSVRLVRIKKLLIKQSILTIGLIIFLTPTILLSSSVIEIGRDGRFIAYDNGTVLDTKTGLMWASKDNGEGVNWKKAKQYCENYRGGGYTDWRMPTIRELEGLYDKNISGYKQDCGQKGPLKLTKLIHITCYCAWASERRGHKAASFVFSSGTWYLYDESNSGAPRALPVRGGN